MSDHDDISIYLGNKCNFDCTYCDRDYIATSIGGQESTRGDIDNIVTFFAQLDSLPRMVSFHGGEPFLYIKQMERVVDALDTAGVLPQTIFIQTNGSLIHKCESFLQKWGSRLAVSISYDFAFQDLNRTAFSIESAIHTLRSAGVSDIQFQYVMPLHNPAVFSHRALGAIRDVCNKTGVRRLNLIPLRHMRGASKFRVILDDIPVPIAIKGILDTIHHLYIMGIRVILDGHEQGFDKHYYDNHKQMVLSPDGYIYPEYDFLEYKLTNAAIGTWFPLIDVSRVTTDKNPIPNMCVTCTAAPLCGLKYLHGAFDTEPVQANCRPFYDGLYALIQHTQLLYTRPSLFEWVTP